MSAKIKLMSAISLFILMLGVLILGVLAVGTQTITLEGNVNFSVTDKSLWVKSASISHDNATEEPITNFMPGYINSNFNLTIPNQSNSYGAFTLHFEIVNTTTSNYDVTAAYSGTVSGVTVTANPTQIPAASAAITEITDTTPTTQLDITVSNPNGTSIDLSDITISFEEYVSATSASSFTFLFDDTAHTATIGKFIGSETEVVIPSTVNKLTDTTAIEGSDYTVISIGSQAFEDCSSLASIDIPEGVTSIGSSAFRSCSSLTTITIPNSVTSIGYYAFLGCSSLVTVNFGDSSQLTSIGNQAFWFCNSLTSITLPSSVTSIGRDDEQAFQYCDSLTSIEVDPANTTYSSEDGVLFNKDKTILVAYPGGGSAEYTIPSSVTSIGSAAFSGCSSLTTITISDSVEIIGDDAFNDCYNLTNVYFGEDSQLTSIGTNAFSWCTSLEYIDFNCPYLYRLGLEAFSGCENLTRLDFSKSSLYEVNVDGDGVCYYGELGGVLFGDTYCLEVVVINLSLYGNSELDYYPYFFEDMYSTSGITSVYVPMDIVNEAIEYVGERLETLAGGLYTFSEYITEENLAGEMVEYAVYTYSG